MTEEFCECGILVHGTSEKHLKENMKKHKEGNQHKKQMDARKKK